LPAIAEGADGRFFILAAVEGDKALVQDPAVGRPETLQRAEFESRWSGRLILVTRRHSVLGKGGSFDISWFVPVLARYRRIFGEVLVASFFLQIFALITPLFFQVVICFDNVGSTSK
jgi:subfamily B ATP-binding cassette protein HlyB/CyaB